MGRKEVLVALRAARDTLKADPTKVAEFKAVRKAIRAMRGNDERDSTEDATELADAAKFLKNLDPTTITADDEDWLDAVDVVRKAFGSMAEDDSDPSVLDRKKIRRWVRSSMEGATNIEVRKRAEHYLYHVFGGAKKATDPCMVEAAAAANSIKTNALTMTLEELQAALQDATECM